MNTEHDAQSSKARAATRIAALFDADCITEEAATELVDDQLFPEEHAFIARAVPKRRAEFGSARLCARRALARLGIPAGALLPQPDRAPSWPAGSTGSISHSRGYCAVVVARSDHYRSLGLDVEEDKTLTPAITEMICTPAERRTLATRSPRDAVLYFAAKEAFYKCQYPVTKTFLDFLDVELRIDFEAGTFETTLRKAIARKPAWIDRLPGRFERRDGLVLCAVTLRATQVGAEEP